MFFLMSPGPPISTCTDTLGPYTTLFRSWDRLRAEGEELLAYFEGVARDHGVLPLIRFGDEVVRLVYVDGKWNLTTAAGYRDRFDLVISATGVLHHPNVPEFEGLESFKGASFHSSRWAHGVALAGRKTGLSASGRA